MSPGFPPTDLADCSTSVLGVDFLVEEVLSQQVELPVLFSDSVRPDELKLLECKLVEVVLHLPDGRLLQLGDGLFCGRLFLTGLPQVRFLSCDSSRGSLKGARRYELSDLAQLVEAATGRLVTISHSTVFKCEISFFVLH